MPSHQSIRTGFDRHDLWHTHTPEKKRENPQNKRKPIGKQAKKKVFSPPQGGVADTNDETPVVGSFRHWLALIIIIIIIIGLDLLQLSTLSWVTQRLGEQTGQLTLMLTMFNRITPLFMFVDCDYYNVFHGQQKREYPVFEIKTGGAWKKVGNKTHEPQCDYLETRRTRFSGTKTRTHLYISMWISTICARFCSTAWVALCNYCFYSEFQTLPPFT